MEQIIKGFLGVFIAFVVAFLGIGMINTSTQSKNADEYLDAMATQWEASNFTMTKDQLIASVNGGDAGAMDNIRIVNLEYSRTPAVGRVKFASITMTYQYNVPILGVSEERTITKSIR